jgi:hypothetical protein
MSSTNTSRPSRLLLRSSGDYLLLRASGDTLALRGTPGVTEVAMDEFAESGAVAFEPALEAGNQTLTPDTATATSEAFDPAGYALGSVVVTVADFAQSTTTAIDPTLLIALVVDDFAQASSEAFDGVFAAGNVNLTLPDFAVASGETFAPTLSASGNANLAIPDVAASTGEALDPAARELVYVVVPDLGESSAVAFDPTATLAAPRAPINLKVVRSVGFTSAVLTWTARGGTSFKVYRSDAQRGLYALVGSPTGATYTDSGIDALNNYAYKVSAVSGGVESAPTPTTFTAGNKAKL